jgi:hypothetical protein
VEPEREKTGTPRGVFNFSATDFLELLSDVSSARATLLLGDLARPAKPLGEVIDKPANGVGAGALEATAGVLSVAASTTASAVADASAEMAAKAPEANEDTASIGFSAEAAAAGGGAVILRDRGFEEAAVASFVAADLASAWACLGPPSCSLGTPAGLFCSTGEGHACPEAPSLATTWAAFVGAAAALSVSSAAVLLRVRVPFLSTPKKTSKPSRSFPFASSPFRTDAAGRCCFSAAYRGDSIAAIPELAPGRGMKQPKLLNVGRCPSAFLGESIETIMPR